MVAMARTVTVLFLLLGSVFHFQGCMGGDDAAEKKEDKKGKDKDKDKGKGKDDGKGEGEWPRPPNSIFPFYKVQLPDTKSEERLKMTSQNLCPFFFAFPTVITWRPPRDSKIHVGPPKNAKTH